MSRFDVVVLGGGPAGCAAATLMARRSHRVALVRPDAPPASPLAESVPPSAQRILEELGFLDAVGRAGFHPNRGNSVWWAGDEPRTESFAPERIGFHADRAGLEAALGRAAEQAGVSLLSGASARNARQDPNGWSVTCERADGSPLEVDGTWLVDATGRHGLLARHEGREPDRSTTTLALVRRWRHPGGWPGVAEGHTLVESYADGWAWSVPLSDHVRCFTAMVDQRRAELAGDVSTMLDAELDRTERLGPARAGAEPVGDAWACPASLYSASIYARPGLILAGDAGSFIDPLSSFGVKKALSSGWLAGVTAHTALVDPAMTDVALAFFDAREREVYRAYRRASAPFFESAGELYGTAYWQERAEAARRAGGVGHREGSEDEMPDPDRLSTQMPEAAVRRAFEEIRRRDRLSARRGTTLRTFECAGIDGHRIVLQDHVGSDACPEGMRWVRGVDLRKLIEIAPAHAEVPDGWTAYNGVAPPVSLPDYLTALATAFAAGFLEHGA